MKNEYCPGKTSSVKTRCALKISCHRWLYVIHVILGRCASCGIVLRGSASRIFVKKPWAMHLPWGRGTPSGLCTARTGCPAAGPRRAGAATPGHPPAWWSGGDSRTAVPPPRRRSHQAQRQPVARGKRGPGQETIAMPPLPIFGAGRSRGLAWSGAASQTAMRAGGGGLQAGAAERGGGRRQKQTWTKMTGNG